MSAARPSAASPLRVGLAVAILATFAAATRLAAAEAPPGEVLRFSFESSRIFPGTVRDYQVFVPAQYDGRTPACVHVNQDGIQFDAPTVLARLIHEGRMPVTIGVFVMHGRVPPTREGALPRFNRSLEYDGLGDAYCRFLLDELLPDVETRTATDGRRLVLSRNATDRSIGGTSSGAIAAFTAAWERPDAFSRVFSGIGTYVGLRGGQDYPTLVRKVEPKPIRVFLQGGSKDLDIYGGDWWIANQAMERSLAFAGYEVAHAWGDGGHDNRHATEVFPEAMEWLWKGWPAPPASGPGSPQLREILLADEPWRIVGEGYGSAAAPVADRDGTLFFTDAETARSWSSRAGGEPVPADAIPATAARAFAPDGGLVSSDGSGTAIVKGGGGGPEVLARGWRAERLVVDDDGTVFATEIPAGEGAPARIHAVARGGEESVVDFDGVPAGVCLSTDQSLLYVADSRGHFVTSYCIAPGTRLVNEQRYYHLHVPDTADDAGAGGMCVDTEGRLWVATRMGLQVCDQAGRVNCIVPVPAGRPTDVCFAGPERDTIVVTCGDRVFARKVRARGAAAYLPAIEPPAPRL